MKSSSILLALCSAVFFLPLNAATTIYPNVPAPTPSSSTGKSVSAYDLFRAGHHAQAVEKAKPLADSGDADALFLLGFAYEHGQGAKHSLTTALDYYKKSDEQGHPEAGFRRALILLNSKTKDERETGRKELEAAAKKDASIAGRILGEAWFQGLLSEESDPEKALSWWEKSAKAGDNQSLLYLARIYSGELHIEGKTDMHKALDYLRKAAENGEASSYLPLASQLLNGGKEGQNEAEGRKWIEKAISEGQILGWFLLGDYEENTKKDLKVAQENYEKGAEAEQADCMLALARFYYQGLSVEKDKKEGFKWLEKAAKAGSASAHLELANLLMDDKESKHIEIYTHLIAASNSGLAAAENQLGLLYLSGSLGASDAVAAISWFTRAAKQGHANAQYNLAALYERGIGTPINLQNAGELYALSANQRHPQAMTALARFLNFGIATKTNQVRGWALANYAKELGDDKADELIQEITKALSVKQQAEARKELEKLKKDASTDEGK